ncbi:MAG TPA: ABC transporter permease subunit, partial [Clostridia bacterium]|nr:ABC transporter permease subunit [Clostridia bacterium]
MPNKRRDAYYTLGGTLLILVLWQALAWLGGTGFLLPSPARVLNRFFDLFTQSASWRTVLTSAGRIIPSILLAIGLAILFAWLASRLRPLRFILAPLILVMKAVPIVSFILIALFFMGETFLTIFICSLIVFPLVYSQLLSAFLNVDPGLLEMGRVFSLSRRESIRYIVIPGCLEPFLAAVSVAVGMAWKAGVAAEVLAFARGTMGRHMHEAKLYLDMEKLLAWTLALVLVAFLSEQLMVALFRQLLTFIGQNLPRLKEAKTSKDLKTRSQLLDDEQVCSEGPVLCPL